MLFRAAESSAQGSASGAFTFTPNSVFDSVFDQYGNAYLLKNIAINDTLRARDTIQVLKVPTYTSGYFKLYLDKNCGMENYATDSNHLARLQVMCQMLNDVSQFVNSPCGSTGQTINIWCRDIGLMSNIPASSRGVISSFYNIPLVAGISGIADNTVWKTINSGIDAYKNIGVPWNSDFNNGTTFFHAILAFNFNGANGVTWNTSLTTAPANNANTFDLYTEALHQMVHALGFASLIGANGNSLLGATHPYYNRYDMNLKTTGGTPLLTHTGSVSMYNYSFSASTSLLAPGGTCYTDSTICSTAIKYYGGLPIPQSVYTPNCFEPGVSLGNFEDQCLPSGSSSPMVNNQYFLMSNVTNPGSMAGSVKRHPQAEEQQVLVDIGYSVNNYFGDASNSHLNYINYGTSYTPGGQVAGNTDGMNNGVNTFPFDTSANLTISGYTLLGNDSGVIGGGFEGLQMISGSGAFSAGNGDANTSIVVTGIGAGVNIFSYVPISATGVKGNITYGPLAKTTNACTGTPCNLVPDPGFESVLTPNPYGCGPIFASSYPYISVYLSCWMPCINTPDLYVHNCTTTNTYVGPNWYFDNPTPITVTNPSIGSHQGPSLSGSVNNNFLGLWSEYYSSTSGVSLFGPEAIQVKLAAPMVSGNTYTIALWAKVANIDPTLITNPSINSPMVNLPGTVNIGLSSSSVYPTGAGYVCSSIQPTFTQLNANLAIPAPYSQWTQKKYTFTCPAQQPGFGAYDNLIIYNAIDRNAAVWPGIGYPIVGGIPVYSSYILIDDVQLTPNTIPDFLPPQINECDVAMIHLSQYISPFISGGTFGGPGVTQANGGTFSPANLSGDVTIWYTYTNACGDQQTIFGTVKVSTPTLTLSASPNPICVGTPVTLTPSEITTYNWSGGVSCGNCASVPAVSPTTTTTYTVTEVADANCTASVTVTVNNISSSIYSTNSTTVCQNNTTNNPVLHALPNNPFYLYTWELSTNNGATYNFYSSGSGQSSITPSVSAPGTYYFRVTVFTGMCGSTSTGVPIVVNASPSANVLFNQPSTFCQGDYTTLTATATPSGTYTYAWYQTTTSTTSGGTLISSTATTPHITTSGFYYVVVTNTATGCSKTFGSYPTIAAPLPTPIANVGGQATVCYGTGGVVLTSSISGTGYTYQWYKNTVNNTTTGTAIAGATASTYAATVTGYYYVKVSIGTCVGTSPAVLITIMGNSETCNPCAMFGGVSNFTTLGGSVTLNNAVNNSTTSSLNNTSNPVNYYVDADIIISGTVNLTNAYFLIAKNVTIYIAPTANVTLTHCHLWSCDGPWNTVSLQTLGSNTGKLTLNNTVIENAVTGITINNAASSTALLLDAEGAVFNNDQNGISISSYPYNTIPFKISGSIFCNIASTNAYNNYMNLLTASVLNWIYNPTGQYTPPWYLTSIYTNTTARGNYGIYLNGVGNTSGIMAIGDNNSLGTTNLFYNYAYGIYAVNSSMTLQNNGFVNMSVDGVYASANSPCNVINVGVAGHFVNQFYNCASSCVEANGYNNFSGQNCVMVGGQPNISALYGYNVIANAASTFGSSCSTPANVNISGNNITNVGVGIKLSSTVGGTGKTISVSPQSTITISNNTLQADFGTPTGSHHMNTAISLTSSVLLTWGQLTPFQGSAGTATVSGNIINNVYNGILAYGFAAQTLSTINNPSISLTLQSGSPTQYGIYHAGCPNSGIKNNIIYSTTPQAKMIAVCVANSQGSAVSCNTTHDIGVGFEYYNQPLQTPLTWTSNSMQNELNGLYISYNKIGQQGTITQTAGNYWSVTPAWAGANYQTNLDNSANAYYSPLYCIHSTTGLPNYNKGVPSNFAYSTNNGLFISTTTVPPPCPLTKGGGGIGSGIGISGGGFLQGTNAVAAMEQVAQDSVVYGQDVNINRWMAQYALYQAMQGDVLYNDDSTLSYETPTDSSTILSTFYTMAQSSRFAYLSSIEYYLSTNSTDSAQALLSSPVSGYVEMDGTTGVSITDVSDADYIVANYTKYYNIHLNYLDSTMSSSDSSDLVALTNLCPATNGDVVYKARALYTTLYNDVKVWEDGDLCSNAEQQQGRMPSSVAAVHNGQQAYSLHPNPNNGHMDILQAKQDNDPVQAEVWNSEGQRLYSTTLLFEQKNAKMDIGTAVPGVYLLQLTDSKGNNYALKFVVH